MLLVVVLVGVVMWQLWPQPQTRFVTLTIQQYDDVAVPPLAFSKVDGEKFGDSANVWNDLQRSDHVDVAGQLQKLEFSEGDVLVMYVRTHGVSDYEKPPPTSKSQSSEWAHSTKNRSAYLLCFDYIPGTATGRYRVNKLLEALKSCRASVKLLVLDPGSIGTDPRFGMMINEFSDMIVEDVKGTDDPNLWVLLPNGILQPGNRGLPAQSRSPFAEALGDAFRDFDDTADLYEDKKLSLSELYGYLLKRSRGWSKAGVHPVLINGATGRVADPAKAGSDVFVYSLSKQDKSEEEEEPVASKRPEVQDRATSARLAERTRHAGLQPALSRPKRFSRHFRGNSAATVALLQKVASEKPAPTKEEAKSSDGPSGDGASNPGAEAKEAAAGSPAPAPKGDDEARPESATVAPLEASHPEKKTTETPAEFSKRLKSMPMTEMVEFAWGLRDELQYDINSSGRADGWSPVDYAPHLWRLLNARLLAYERDSIFKNDELADYLKDRTDGLRDLVKRLHQLKERRKSATGRSEPPPTGKEDVGKRLLESWIKLHSERSDVVDDWKVVPSSNPNKSALRLGADVNFLAPYYVAWYDAASLTSPADDKLDGAFETIEALLDQLDRFNASLARATKDDSRLKDSKQLEKPHADLLTRYKGVTEILKDAVDRAKDDPNELNGQRAMLDLLSTPLLQQSQRSELRVELAKDKFNAPDFSGNRDSRPWEPSPKQWKRAKQRAILHGKLVRLFAPSSARDITDAVGTLQEPDDVRLKTHARIGQHIRAAYDQTLFRLLDKSATATALDLTLVDARDVPSIMDERTLKSLDFLKECPIARPAPTLALTRLKPSDDPFPLSLSRKRLSVKLVATGLPKNTDLPKNNAQGAIFVFKHSDQLKVFKSPDDEKPTEGWTKPNGLTNGSGTLDLWVQATRNRRKGDRKVKLEISATVNGIPVKGELDIYCELPWPDRVDVVFKRVGAGEDVSDADDDDKIKPGPFARDPKKFRLRPFPNRLTSYDLSLINRSGKPRKVKVELFAAKRPKQGANWPPGRMFYEEEEHKYVFEAVQRANNPPQKPIKTWMVDLPAGTKATPLKASVAKSAPGDPKKPVKPPVDPKAEIGTVTHGLICVISDVDMTDEKSKTTNYGQEWTRWIEFEPREPSDYLDVRVEFKESPQGGGVVSVTISPKGDYKKSLPATEGDPAENPIEIEWQADPEFRTKTSGPPRTISLWKKPDASAPAESAPKAVELSHVVVKDDDRPNRIVWLNVDGYPRAFVLKVPVDGRNRRVRDMRKDDLISQVRIASLHGPRRERIYVPPAGNALVCPERPDGDRKGKDASKEKSDSKPERFELTKDAPIVFKMTDRDDRDGKFKVRLQVDVSRSNFRSPGEQKLVVVMKPEIGDPETVPLYAARQVRIDLKSASPEGRLTFFTAVSDHTVSFDRLSEGKKSLVARLEGTGASVSNPAVPGVQLEHAVDVVFVGDKPTILSLRRRNPGGAGRTIKASAVVKDTSGFIRIMHAFGKKGGDEKELKWIESKIEDAKTIDGKNEKWKDVKTSKQVNFDAQIPEELLVEEFEGSEQTLLVRVIDYVNQESKVEKLKFTVPTKATAAVGPGKTGTIKGYVVIGDGETPLKNSRGMKVTITGEVRKQKSIDAKGYFSFEGVPAGKYTLKASGTVKGYKFLGSRKDVEPSDTPIYLKVEKPKKK